LGGFRNGEAIKSGGCDGIQRLQVARISILPYFGNKWQSHQLTTYTTRGLVKVRHLLLIDGEDLDGPVTLPALADVRLPPRIRNSLVYAGLKMVGDVREYSDANLMSLHDVAKGTLSHLRDVRGMSSAGS
jgi:hypothetical protein